MAIISIVYFRKRRTKGSFLFSIGAICAATGSMFNQLFPKHLFIEQSSGTLPLTIKTMGTIALSIHLVGFFAMVIAWGIITFEDVVE
jgi:hypothetical protein